MIDGAYRVSVPAVKRSCLTKYFWNSAGSTPSPPAFAGSFGGALNIFANSRSKSISFLGDCPAFVRIGAQQLRRASPPQDRRQFPPQIEGVLHGDVHALPGFRAVGMAGVAGDEHARKTLRLRRRVVELVAKALADLVNRPPGDLLHLQRIGMQDPPRRGDQIVGRDVQARDPFVLIEFLELDVEADEITAFAWNDQEAAFIGRLDRRLEANVGEVGDSQDIHDAPGLIGRIPYSASPSDLRTALRAPSQPTMNRALTVSVCPACAASSRSNLTVTG